MDGPARCCRGAEVRRQSGFSLIEVIMVLVITGIVGAITASFIQRPVASYFDAARRAALSDTADLALRRIGRELRTALPNSVRIAGAGSAIEFVPTVAAGRYAQVAAEPCFVGSGCTSLTMLGSLGAAANAYAGFGLVIFNYYNNSGGDCAAATLPSIYCDHNAAAVTASTTTSGQDRFSFAATRFYPANGSPNRRFQLVGGPVSFVCSGSVLRRYTGYPRQALQPTGFALGSSAVLATGISACSFSYQAGVLQRLGLVAARLALTSEGETVSLYEEIHVDNTP